MSAPEAALDEKVANALTRLRIANPGGVARAIGEKDENAVAYSLLRLAEQGRIRQITLVRFAALDWEPDLSVGVHPVEAIIEGKARYGDDAYLERG